MASRYRETDVATSDATEAAEQATEATEQATEAVEQTSSEDSGGTQTNEKVVRYVGLGSKRILTEEDWKRVGAEGQGTAEWTMLNEYKLPASQFSEAALRYLNIDDGFVITTQE